MTSLLHGRSQRLAGVKWTATIARRRRFRARRPYPVRSAHGPPRNPIPGGDPGSSTRSTPAPSPTATATAWATWRASGRHLDHLAWLGIDAVWLSPFYRSPMADFGYDVGRLHRRRSPLRRPRRTSTGSWPRPTPWASGSSSTSCRTTPPTSTPGSGRPDAAGPTPSGTGTCGATAPAAGPAQQLAGRLHRRTGVDLGRAHRAVVPAPVPAPAARPQLGQPGGRRGHARRAALLARPGRRRVPHRRRPLHRPGSRPSRTTCRPGPRSPTAPSNEFPSTHEHVRGLRRLVDGYPGDRVIVGETALPGTRWVAAVLRRGRRAAPRVQLRRHPRAVGRDGRGATASTGSIAELSPRRCVAHLGALQPRHPPPPHPLRRQRGPGPRRRRRPAHPARHALPLRRRGARPGGRRRAPRAGRRPRRARRLPRADPLDDRGRPRLGRRPVAALPARRRPAGRRRPSGRTRRRSSTSTVGCSPPAGHPQPCRSATSSSSTRRTACWHGVGRAREPAVSTAPTSARWPSASGSDEVAVDLVGEVEVASDGAGEGAPFTGRLPGDSAVLLRGPGYSTSG